MEADLARYYQDDYRDRWRRGSDGRPLLSLRMIRNRLQNLPADAATPRALGSDGLTQDHLLLMDVYSALVGKPHPAGASRTKAAAQARDPKHERRRRAALARKRARETAIAAGEIA